MKPFTLFIQCTFFISAFSLSFHAAAQEVVANEILIGQSTPLTGLASELGIPSSESARAYFDHVNDQGGIHGRKIKFIVYDDAYSPQQAVKNVQKLIGEDHVFAICGIVGTPSNIAVLPIIAKENIPMIAPGTGSDLIRKPLNPFVFNVRASYQMELNKIFEHMEIRGISKIAIAFQNNAFGKEGYEHAKGIAAARSIQISAATSMENDASNAAEVASLFSTSAPQAILLVTVGKPSIALIKEYRKLVAGAQFFGLSPMGSQTILKALGSDGVGLVISQVVPFPYSATSEIVREYQGVMGKAGLRNLSFASMEGYITAKIVVEALKRTGKDLTKKKFVKTLSSMSNVDLGGFIVDFNDRTQQGSRFVDLTVISRKGQFIR